MQIISDQRLLAEPRDRGATWQSGGVIEWTIVSNVFKAR